MGEISARKWYQSVSGDAKCAQCQCNRAAGLDQITTVLLLVAALQIKHLVADFFLQNAKMIMGREKYWHMGRAQYAGIHAVFSIIVLAVFGASPMLIFWMVLVEFIAFACPDFDYLQTL